MGAPLRTTKRPTPAVKPGADKVRVMLVDDSLTVRTVFQRMIQRQEDMAIVASASTAERALADLRTTEVDVILLDLEMPGMGGLEALPRILATAAGAKVLVVSSLTAAGAEHTLQALSMGAADTMLKPRPGGFDDHYRETLLGKIRALKGSHASESAGVVTPLAAPHSAGKQPQVVAIGASTGGIHALNLFLRKLPGNFDLPILITQHLPPSFIPVFARQMATAAGREAVLAEDGLEIRRGQIVIAQGHGHMIVRRAAGKLVTGLAFHTTKSGCTPSVDPMFETLAEACDGHVTGVLLSGMGRDGTDGAHAIVRAGGTIFAQDAQTSAVWGMPRAVAESGIAAAVLPPEGLAERLLATAGASAWL